MKILEAGIRVKGVAWVVSLQPPLPLLQITLKDKKKKEKSFLGFRKGTENKFDFQIIISV